MTWLNPSPSRPSWRSLHLPFLSWRLELARRAAGLVPVLLVALFFWALPAGAQEQDLSKADKRLMLDASQDLTECAGYYYAKTEVALQMEAESADEAHIAHDLGNRSHLAAAWLLVLLGVVDTPREAMQYTKGNVETSRAHWRVWLDPAMSARAGGSGPDPGPMIEGQQVRCVELNPVRTVLVQHAAQWARTYQPQQQTEEAD
jgi:hypothetical protein